MTRIQKDKLYDYYITQNHTREECVSYFGYTLEQVRNALYRYRFIKVKQLGISKDELYDYYIKQNHNRSECASHFNCSVDQIKRLIRRCGISKYPPKYKVISAQDVYEYYVVQKHTILETQKHFNCNGQIITDKIHEMGVRKAAPKNSVSKIKKKEVYDYYITNNHTLEETSKYFNISKTSLICLIRKYGIHKDINLTLSNTKKTCLKKYGVENVAHSKEIARLRGGKYSYNGVNFDSKWELYFYIYSIDHNFDITRCPCVYNYKYNNKIYTYVPDFKCNNTIIEIKGNQFLNNNKFVCPYDHSQDGVYNAKYQCMLENNVVIMYKNDLKYVFDYIKDTYGKNYGNQFKK